MSTHATRTDRSTPGSRIASALAGGAAGVAVGLLLAQLFGGASGLAARIKRAAVEEFEFEPGGEALDQADDEFDGEWEDTDGIEEADDALGERVLEAFRNDPTLAERPIDIDVHPDATIELSGRVDADREIDYAATIALGIPGVRHVVTRLGVGDRGWRPSPV